MKKIIVIGCPGAGKSCFARRLHDALSLPLFYLDMIWHRADKTNISREEFDRRLSEITEKGEWIIDGNYIRTLEMRLSRCDTVFFLDYTVEQCLEGAKARIGKAREDMPWVEDCLDDEFLQWILDFPQAQLPEIYRLLEKYDTLNIHVFKTRKEADSFLASIV